MPDAISPAASGHFPDSTRKVNREFLAAQTHAQSFLFQGGEPVRVRRRLPNDHQAPVAVLATLIRVLLASPRPVDDACGYLDHRVSAGPLVDTMEALAGQVELRLLTPPTLPALRDELERAPASPTMCCTSTATASTTATRAAVRSALKTRKTRDTRVVRAGTSQFLRPNSARSCANTASLVFLEACQSAQAESANESVASALLKTGVGSVVAMSHSVLVETARRFVEAFYRALSRGERVGSAMLAGQHELKDNPARGRVFGIGEVRLHDWFVPVLYQDRDDLQLFRSTPSRQTLADWRKRLEKRLGKLPDPPAHGFVGRSRELLELERMLASERYAVVRGQGGEALARARAGGRRRGVCRRRLRPGAGVLGRPAHAGDGRERRRRVVAAR